MLRGKLLSWNLSFSATEITEKVIVIETSLQACVNGS